ncbi:MAG: hypothetical protein E7665_05900 [Ruminococcaceae bacterium]|nr:hypothetical protein [Oscillospiraceae bacterium]
MKQTEWKIIYTNYNGITKNAIKLLSAEAGKYLIREKGVYRIHVLPCEKEGSNLSKNAFIIGLYNESALIRKFIKEDEIKKDGFAVRVVKNPCDDEGRFVILTSFNESELYYAVVSFFDDYISKFAPKHGSNRMPDLIFDSLLPEYTYTEAPAFKRRSIFTWGHSINNYREYIDNMARNKYNELIIWNDHVPLNIDEVIEYAHSYGISVNLGYSWGWIDGCGKITDISDETLYKLKNEIVDKYEKEYAPHKCDGIYFQSFTERFDSYIGTRLIAEAVTSLVNNTSAELLSKYPDLKLQFGLHASSVSKHLDEIAKVDKRVEILWEDCGSFPYHYNSFVESEDYFENTLAFTDKLLALRNGEGVGLVFKGVMMLDWTKFVDQRGVYILGENCIDTADHDREIRRKAWRLYSRDWMNNGGYVKKTLAHILNNKLGEVNMCIAGTFDGGIYLPFALCGEMFRNPFDEYESILSKVSARTSVEI